jgi:hypothetical protein
MKKQEKKDKTRRLILSRETIHALDEQQVLLKMAQGGFGTFQTSSGPSHEISGAC